MRKGILLFEALIRLRCERSTLCEEGDTASWLQAYPASLHFYGLIVARCTLSQARKTSLSFTLYPLSQIPYDAFVHQRLRCVAVALPESS